MGREVSKEKLYNLVEILKIEVNKLYEVLEDKLSCKEENKSENGRRPMLNGSIIKRKGPLLNYAM